MTDLLLLAGAGLAVALVNLLINLKTSRKAPVLKAVSFFGVYVGLLYAVVMLALLTLEIL